MTIDLFSKDSFLVTRDCIMAGSAGKCTNAATFDSSSSKTFKVIDDKNLVFYSSRSYVW